MTEARAPIELLLNDFDIGFFTAAFEVTILLVFVIFSTPYVSLMPLLTSGLTNYF